MVINSTPRILVIALSDSGGPTYSSVCHNSDFTCLCLPCVSLHGSHGCGGLPFQNKIMQVPFNGYRSVLGTAAPGIVLHSSYRRRSDPMKTCPFSERYEEEVIRGFICVSITSMQPIAVHHDGESWRRCAQEQQLVRRQVTESFLPSMFLVVFSKGESETKQNKAKQNRTMTCFSCGLPAQPKQQKMRTLASSRTESDCAASNQRLINTLARSRSAQGLPIGLSKTHPHSSLQFSSILGSSNH